MNSSGLSINTSAGSVLEILGIAAVLLLGLLGALVLVILVVSNRAEPDSRGLRPFSVYLFGMSFVALWVAYVGSIAIVESLTLPIEPHPVPLTNSVAKGVTVGAIFLILAGGVLAYHLSHGRRIALSDERVDGPNRRVFNTYVAAVVFVAIAVAVIALGVAIYQIFAIAGPGIYGNRAPTSALARSLVDFAYVFVSAAVLAWLHLRMGPRPLLPGFLRRASGPATLPPGAATHTSSQEGPPATSTVAPAVSQTT